MRNPDAFSGRWRGQYADDAVRGVMTLELDTSNGNVRGTWVVESRHEITDGTIDYGRLRWTVGPGVFEFELRDDDEGICGPITLEDESRPAGGPDPHRVKLVREK